jgi:hypothetical protein
MPPRAAPTSMRALAPVPRPLWDLRRGAKCPNGVEVEAAVAKYVDIGVGVE